MSQLPEPPKGTHANISLAGLIYLVPIDVLRAMDPSFGTRVETEDKHFGKVWYTLNPVKTALMFALGDAPAHLTGDPRDVEARVWVRAVTFYMKNRAQVAGQGSLQREMDLADRQLHAARVLRQAHQLACRAAGKSEAIEPELPQSPATPKGDLNLLGAHYAVITDVRCERVGDGLPFVQVDYRGPILGAFMRGRNSGDTTWSEQYLYDDQGWANAVDAAGFSTRQRWAHLSYVVGLPDAGDLWGPRAVGLASQFIGKKVFLLVEVAYEAHGRPYFQLRTSARPPGTEHISP